MEMMLFGAFHMALVTKKPPAIAGGIRDLGSIPGPGRSPGGGRGNPFQYPCLENPAGRGAWWATVHAVAESDMTEVTEHAACTMTFTLWVVRNIFIYICVCVCIHCIKHCVYIYTCTHSVLSSTWYIVNQSIIYKLLLL